MGGALRRKRAVPRGPRHLLRGSTLNVPAWKLALDPLPFHLLGLIVGTEALVLSCFVLMNQDREDPARARRDDAEYRVNIDAEQEVRHLHERLDEVQRVLEMRLPPRNAPAR